MGLPFMLRRRKGVFVDTQLLKQGFSKETAFGSAILAALGITLPSIVVNVKIPEAQEGGLEGN